MKVFFVFFKLLSVIGATGGIMIVGLHSLGFDGPVEVLLQFLFLPVVAAPLIYLFIIRDIQKHFNTFIAFETLILNLSNRFINVPAEKIDTEIEDALKEIGESLRIDQTSLLIFSNDDHAINTVYQWSSQERFSTKSAFSQLDLQEYRWFLSELEHNKAVYINHLGDIPAAGQAEKAVFEAVGMKSFLILPVTVNNRIVGILGFGSYVKNVTWSHRESTLLKIAGEMLANLLFKKEKSLFLHKLSMALEQTADNVIITDRDGIIEYVNPAFETLTGFSREEALGRKPSLVKSSKMDPSYYDKLWDTITAGKNFTGTVINKRKNGELYYEEKNISPIFDAQGTITHFVSTGKDITRQKEMENELKLLNATLQKQVEEEITKRHNSFKMLENIYKGSIVGIVLAGTDGTILESNPAFETMLGYEEEELNGVTFSRITHPDDINANLDLFEAVVEGRLSHYTMKKRYLTKKGDIVWGNIIVRTIKDDSGEIKFLLAMIEDITEKTKIAEKQRIQEELMTHQSKMAAMGEMIGAIAHQWRQPLNALGLQLQEIGDAYDYGELNKKSLHAAIETSQRHINFMSKTIDEFRDFFKPSKERVHFDLHSEIDHVIAILDPQIRGTDISLRFEKESGETLMVYGLANEFKQVVLNLLNNSKDAITANKILGGKITVSTALRGKEAVIRISDNGGGIPESLIEKIFDPYFTTKGSSGTGVGLHIAKLIIEEHMHGSLRVANSDHGALFTVILPLE